jgi:hypothetical protein
MKQVRRQARDVLVGDSLYPHTEPATAIVVLHLGSFDGSQVDLMGRRWTGCLQDNARQQALPGIL